MSLEVAAPVLHEPRQPLRVERVAVEDPRAGEVRVRLAASGVCHSCLHAADGSHEGIPMPIVLGDEGAGVVEAVGSGVADLAAGDHVIISWAPGCGRCRYCRHGFPGVCVNAAAVGLMEDGTTRFQLGGEPVYHYGPATFAPVVVVSERAAIKVRPEIPLELAALIGCAVATGVGTIVRSAGVRAGESVVVVGCGGVGLNALQGAALVGANPVVAVDLSDAKLAVARGFGATHAVRADADGAVEEVRRVTAGGAEHCVVAVGSVAAIEQALELLAPRGQCVVVGAPPSGSRVSFDPLPIVAAEKRIVGARYGSSEPATDFPRLVDLYLAGRLKLDELVSTRYRVEQTNEALDALARGADVRGVIVFDD